MTKMIVASFKDEASALNAIHKLNTLESFGDISIYEMTMIRKVENGDYEILKGDGNDGWKAVGSMVVGGLLGAIAGPIGLLLGLYAGVAIGGFAEINHYDMEDDFIKKIESKMTVGTVSIFAEIDEEDNNFIDIALKPFGATILKTDIDFAYDNYLNEQVEKIENDIAEQRAGLKKAIGKDKEKIEKKITTLKETRKTKLAEFEAEAKKSANDLKTKTGTAVDKVKTGVKKIAEHLTESAKENKSNRIKRKIEKYEVKLSNLKMEIKAVNR